MKVQSIFSPVYARTFFLGLVFLFAVGSGNVFAKEFNPINEKVKEAFNKEFAGAQFVSWAESGDYHKATFVLAGHRAEAYFTSDGEFLACIRDLFFDQMPLSVMKAFDQRFASAAILDVREVTNTEGTFYLVNLEHNDRKYQVRSDVEGNFSEVQKAKK